MDDLTDLGLEFILKDDSEGGPLASEKKSLINLRGIQDFNIIKTQIKLKLDDNDKKNEKNN